MKKTLFYLFALVINLTMQAQTAGTLDTNFGTSGSVFAPAQKNSYPYCIEFEAYSGEIAIAGQYKKTSSLTVGYVGRYDFYGNPRTAFGTNGVLEISDLSTTIQIVSEVLFTGNSGFIVRGTYKDASNATVLFFRKYLANGTLDTTFGTGGTLTGLNGEINGNYIYSLKTNPTTKHQYLNRYHLANGTLDATFNSSEFPFLTTDSRFYGSQYRHINFQANGKIVLCGYKTINAVNYPFIGRFDSLGNSDTTFGTNGYFIGANPGEAWQTKTQSDGKIVYINNSGPQNGTNAILNRINANGTVDTSYGMAGSFYYTYDFGGNYVDKMLMQSDDKVLLCGSVAMDANGVSSLFSARVGTTGKLDFKRLDMQSPYSENWSMVMPNETYLLTFGETSNADFSLFTPTIQRIFLKTPIVSLIGDAYPNGNFTNDLNMTSLDGTTYTLNNVSLTSGKAVKFRIDHDWRINWGAAATNPFPTGAGMMGQGDITIPTTGIYNISFNIATGVYNFTNTLSIASFDKNNIVVYPNPAKNQINLQFPNQVRADKITITDLTGKKVLEQNNSSQVNVSNLAKGMYVIEAVSGEEKFVSKFVKE